MSSAAFLGLHALATPGVLLSKNAGFELATPVGLAIAGAFAAGSAWEYGPTGSAAVMRRSRLLVAALGLLVAAWAIVSLAELAPLDQPLAGEQVDGWQVALATVGIFLYAFAALGSLNHFGNVREIFRRYLIRGLRVNAPCGNLVELHIREFVSPI